jgi:gentisate 1,2-dioxygenase
MAQMLRLALFSPLTLAAEPSCRFSSDTTACYSNRSGGVKGYQFEWSKHGEIHEYVSNANPAMAEIPIRVFGPELHSSGPSKVTPLDMKEALEVEYPATVPNLLANFVRITVNDTAETSVDYGATSQAFYVMRGSGTTTSREAAVHWAAGDLFTLPHLGDLPPVCSGKQCVQHFCEDEPSTGGCALYWVHDEPLLRYLGVVPGPTKRFEPAFYAAADMKASVDAIPGVDPVTGEVKNRRGILLGNLATPQTKTLTPTMWSLLNVLAPHSNQAPHKHNSVALDLAVVGGVDGKVHTKIGRDLDAKGDIVDPVIAEWATGGVFVTPPGWWHSHHNAGDDEAWVLPIQDAGLYTHQRTLDIRFQSEEVERLYSKRNRGATQPPQKEQ